eukprot:jgi/Psemu1/61559/gm1.61559_g
MYLCSTLDEPEYVKFRWDMILPRIRIAYKLIGLKQGDYVYARIKKAWYGLKQSGKIPHDDLVDHLQKYGYRKAPHTEGLFLHDDRDINFTLVVDDFGIKYTQQEDVDHLVAAVSAKYTFKVVGFLGAYGYCISGVRDPLVYGYVRSPDPVQYVHPFYVILLKALE